MGKVYLTYLLVSFYKTILTGIVYVNEFSQTRFTKKKKKKASYNLGPVMSVSSLIWMSL